MNHLIIESISSQGNRYQVEINIKPQWQHYWQSKSLESEFYQAIANHIINTPYADASHYKMTINNTVIYRPNHDVGHGLRQTANSQFLLNVVAIHGKTEYKEALKHLTEEELAAVRLAAYLFRAGRTNENAGISDLSNPKRSALVFSKIATAVGFNLILVDNIAFNICNHAPITDDSLSATIPCDGYQGDSDTKRNKSKLIKAILDMSHHSDLVRCWENVENINKENFENLSGLLCLDDVKPINTILLHFARASHAMTGTPYYQDDNCVDKFIPPMLLRRKTVTQVANVLIELSALMTSFIDFASRQDVTQATKKQQEVETLVQEVTPDDKAANVIKRAFRIHRAHKLTSQAVGLVPSNVSKRNLHYLQLEMRQGHGLSNEDKAKLNGEILLQNEKALYQYLLQEFDWVLKHITENLPIIQETGNTLKSLYQRNREQHANDVRYTSDFEGRSDNIYFTISSPNGWPADFLQLAEGHEIRVPIRSFLNKDNIPSDKLSGLWISSAWWGYDQRRQLHSRVDNVIRTVQYNKKDKEIRFINSEDYKLYQWRYPDGHTETRHVPFGFETISGPELLPFLALNTIFELRHTEPDFRHACLSDPKSKILEAFVDMVYEQRNFEALVPATLPLFDTRIQCLPFNQNPHLGSDANDKMIKAIHSFKVEKIDALIQQGYPVDFQLEKGMTPLAYCLLVKDGDCKVSRDMAMYFIIKGANIQTSIKGLSILSMAVDSKDYAIVEAILKKGIYDKRTDRVQRYVDINRDKNAIIIAFKNHDVFMLDLFIEYGLEFSSIPFEVFHLLSETDQMRAIEIFNIMKNNGFIFKEKNLIEQHHLYMALQTCVLKQKYQLLEEWLRAGCPPNVNDFNTGLSILSFAQALADKKAADLLLKHGAIASNVSEKKPIHAHLLVKDNQDRILVVKQRRQDGSVSPFWQNLDYTGAFVSEELIKMHLFSATGLRLVNYEMNLITAVSQQDSTSEVWGLWIKDNHIRANDTETFAKPIWLCKDDYAQLPLAHLAALFVKGASVDTINTVLGQKCRLLKAITDRDLTAVRVCLQTGVVDHDQMALFKACDLTSPDLDIIDALIQYGYDINAVDQQSEEPMTALMYAILHHNLKLISLLIKQGANPNQAVGKFKETPLMFAAKYNDIEILALLSHNGADYAHPANQGVLAFAMFHLCSDTTFYYLAERADCNGRYFELNPILIAAETNESQRIKSLLDKNVDLSAKHPIKRKTAFYLCNEENRGLFNASVQAQKSSHLWLDLRHDYKVYIDYSGATARGQVDEELAREYALTIINKTDHRELFDYFENILQRCRLVEESSKPLFAIAHQGLDYVATCAGFSCPVISIHKELFHNDKIKTEHLTFAIAHELALLKYRGERQFTQISQSQRLEADKKALEVVGNRTIAVEFIQAV